MRIYIVEETPEYDIFGAIMSRFLDRDEAEDYVRDLTLIAFTEGYNVDEHVIIEMMENGYLISCGIYDVKEIGGRWTCKTTSFIFSQLFYLNFIKHEKTQVLNLTTRNGKITCF